MAALKRIDPRWRMAETRRPRTLLAVARGCRRGARHLAKLPGDLLRQLKRCKVIGRFGLGVDNIDIPAATQCGITVTYVPDYCLHEVSDHAMALLLALVRKIPSPTAWCNRDAGDAGRRADPAPARPGSRPGRVAQHSARGRPQGAGFRHAGRHP